MVVSGIGTRASGGSWHGIFADEQTTDRHFLDAVDAQVGFIPTTTAYLDARVFMLYADTPWLVYDPVSRDIYGFDERVDLASPRRVTKSIALFIAEWCGLIPSAGKQ